MGRQKTAVFCDCRPKLLSVITVYYKYSMSNESNEGFRASLNNRLPDGVKIGFGTVYLFTEQGLGFIDRLAEHKIWDRWHDAGILSMFISMIAFLAFLAVSVGLILITDPPASSSAEAQNLLAIPGLNEYIPWSQAGVFAISLFIAMIVHEGGHALAARRAGVNIEEWGIILFLGVIPIGAYVLPDEVQLEEQSTRQFSRVMSAGIMNNYALTLLTMAYFIFLPSTPGMLEVFAMHIQVLNGATEFFALSTFTTLVYWVWFINFNLGIVNTLPIAILDGGRIVGKIFERRVKGSVQIPTIGSVRIQSLLKIISSVGAFLLFVLMAFGARL